MSFLDAQAVISKDFIITSVQQWFPCNQALQKMIIYQQKTILAIFSFYGKN